MKEQELIPGIRVNKMPNRISTILASENSSTAATKTIEINDNTPISRIAIRFKGTNSSSTPTAHPAKMVSKIELVDGSDVLYSLSGIEAQALNFQETGELPFNVCEYEDNIECCATYNLSFGRFLWDPELALNPSRFKNLQLKITHNKALGGSAPDAGTMAVFGYLFDEPQPSPSGFLMSKELKAYTLTASAHEYTDLPTDYPYRILMPMSYESTYAFNTQFEGLSWYADNKKKVFLDGLSGAEIAKILPHLDKVEEDFAGLGTASAVSYYQASTYEGYGTAVGRSATQAAMICGQPSGPRIQITNDASESFTCHENGYMPFGSVNLCMHDLQDIKSWFDPTKYGSVMTDIEAGSGASGTIYQVLQQLRGQ